MVKARFIRRLINIKTLQNLVYKEHQTLLLNGSLSYNDKKEHAFDCNANRELSSDKIFSLGAPEDKTNSASLYNDEIIEKGFVH